MTKRELKPEPLNIFPSAPTMHTAASIWYGKDIKIPHESLMYVLEGGIVMELDHSLYIVPKNHIILIPGGSTYTCWKIPGTPLQYLDFSLCIKWGMDDFFTYFDFSAHDPVMEIPPQSILEIYNTMRHFSSENVPQRLSYCTQLSKLLLLLFEAVRQKEITEDLYGDVLAFMRTHLSEEITLESLAARRNMRPAHFSKKFKEAAGVSPARALSRMRLSHAAALLRARTMSVQQTADAVGFSDVYYFKSFFKAFYGIAPEKFADIFIEPSYMQVKR